MTGDTPEVPVAPEAVSAPQQAVPSDSALAQVENEAPEGEQPDEQKPVDRVYTQKELEDALKARAAKEQRRYERRLEAEVKTMRELARELAAGRAPQQQHQEDAEPQRDQFQDDSLYIKALAKYEARQLLKAELGERQQVSAQERQRLEAEQLARNFSQRAEQMTKERPDFIEKITDPDLVISPPMAEAIASMDNGERVALYLADNPQISEKIANMRPTLAAAELGKIAANLAKPAKQISSAPAPVKPTVSAKALAADLANMSQAEYEAHRRKQGARW